MAISWQEFLRILPAAAPAATKDPAKSFNLAAGIGKSRGLPVTQKRPRTPIVHEAP